ncbi:hypothetical protein PINS_up005606 [Pythium insidiosum]|nr:hypothetical protein PINS_up005606 [Pythium insidiosum]
MAPSLSSVDPLAWVKLRGMQVFWPACVYASYSAAARHAHDTTSLRYVKPVLDVEDRVIVFLGVDAASTASATVQGGVVPNLRQCVAPIDDAATFPWEGADEFAKVCRTYHVPEEMIERASKNGVFRRACRDATQLEDAIADDADARRVFLSFLRRPREAAASTAASASSASAKRKIPCSDSANACANKKRHLDSAPAVPAKSTAPEPQVALGVEWSEDVVAACWQMMKDQGWSTMKQGNGVIFYTTPGTSFFDFRPNVTVFDNLKNAVSKFLQQYVDANAVNAVPLGASSPLEDLLWKTMSENGWQTMTSANETWYIMPNTPFDQCVPNVTIFRSKSQAVASFLASLGVTEPQADEVKETDDDLMSDSVTDQPTDLCDDEIDDMETPVEDDERSDSEVDAESDEESESGASTDDHESEASDDDELETVAQKNGQHKVAPRKADPQCAPRRAVRKVIVKKPTKPVVPPFKCTFGKVEQELRNRGWYWKNSKLSVDGYMYYQPHCRDVADSDLVVQKDCFLGRLGLEEYLESSGMYDQIREKLRRDHERAYGVYDEKEELESAAVEVSTPLPSKPTQVIEISDDEEEVEEPKAKKANGAARRKPSPENIRRNGQKPSSSKAVEFDVKYGDIWKKLSANGWFYRLGMFEYDYCKPDCPKRGGAPGQDYFQSQTLLVDYLKTSGLWEEVAEQIRQDVAKQLHTPTKVKERESNPKPPVSSPAIDLVSSRTPTRSADSNQLPEDPTFQTPTSKIRSAEELSIPDTQDLDAITKSSSKISPDSNEVKPRFVAAIDPGQPPLSRNLTAAFTPSPQPSKRVSKADGGKKNQSVKELAQECVARLTLGFRPAQFSHREEEADQVRTFCVQRFQAGYGGTMYISGAPGCGKSAMLKSLQTDVEQLYQVRMYIPTGNPLSLTLNFAGTW